MSFFGRKKREKKEAQLAMEKEVSDIVDEHDVDHEHEHDLNHEKTLEHQNQHNQSMDLSEGQDQTPALAQDNRVEVEIAPEKPIPQEKKSGFLSRIKRLFGKESVHEQTKSNQVDISIRRHRTSNQGVDISLGDVVQISGNQEAMILKALNEYHEKIHSQNEEAGPIPVKLDGQNEQVIDSLLEKIDSSKFEITEIRVNNELRQEKVPTDMTRALSSVMEAFDTQSSSLETPTPSNGASTYQQTTVCPMASYQSHCTKSQTLPEADSESNSNEKRADSDLTQSARSSSRR